MAIEISPLYIRRSIFIQAPSSEVWWHFGNTKRLSAWLDRGHRLLAYEPGVGGTLEFSASIDGEDALFGGPILHFDVDQELTAAINWHGPSASPQPTFWTFRLTSLYDGTLVELFHHGFDRMGAQAADQVQGYEQAWDIKHLSALRALVEGSD